MKKFMLVSIMALNFCCPVFAHADDDVYGYCSARTYDGNWAVWWGTSIQQSCNIVYDGLARATISRVESRSVGYYNNVGFNEVYVRCYDYEDEDAGYGLAPLSRIFERTQDSGARGCLFTVVRE